MRMDFLISVEIRGCQCIRDQIAPHNVRDTVGISAINGGRENQKSATLLKSSQMSGWFSVLDIFLKKL